MRDWWYGDKRDIVKWGAICVLAQKKLIRAVLQIALYRPDRTRYQLEMDGTAEPLPHEVIRHFRNIDHIQHLAADLDLRVEVHKDLFQWSAEFRTKEDFRKAYFNGVTCKIKEYADPVIVFLDPDTGIAPGNCGYEHVTREEIQTVLRAMKQGDLLLFYQHARQGDRDWLSSTRQDFCQAIGADDPVTTITCKEIASDVAFFMVEQSKWVHAEGDQSKSRRYI